MEVINFRFPHRGAASLAQVSTMGLCPLLKKEAIQKEPCDSKGYTYTPPRGEAFLFN